MLVSVLALVALATVAIAKPDIPADVKAAFCECGGDFETAVGADLVAQVEACLSEAGAPVDEMKAACGRKKRGLKAKKAKLSASGAAEDLEEIAESVTKRGLKEKVKAKMQKKMEECLSGKKVAQADLDKIKAAGEALHDCVKSKIGSSEGSD